MTGPKNNSPKDGELNGIGTKIARPRDGRHKNNSPKGWMCGELYGRYQN